MKKELFLLLSVCLFCAGSFAQNTLDIKTALSGNAPGQNRTKADVYYYRGAATGNGALGYAFRGGTDVGFVNNSSATNGNAGNAWTYERTNEGLEITMTGYTGIDNTGFRFQNGLRLFPLGSSAGGVRWRVYYTCSEQTVWRYVFHMSTTGPNSVLADSSKMNIVFPATDAAGGSVVLDMSGTFNGRVDGVVKDTCNAINNIRFILQSASTVPAGTKFTIKRILIGVAAADVGLGAGRQSTFESGTLDGNVLKVPATANLEYRGDLTIGNANGKLTRSVEDGAFKVVRNDDAETENSDNLNIGGIGTQIREGFGFMSFKYKSDVDLEWENYVITQVAASNVQVIGDGFFCPATSEWKRIVVDMHKYFPLPTTQFSSINIRKPNQTHFTFYMDDFVVGSYLHPDLKSLLSAEVPDVVSADSLLVIGYSGADNATGVTANITLPTANATFGTATAWQSSNPAAIASNGTVASGIDNEPVTLTATTTKGDVIMIKKFTVTVNTVVKTGIDSAVPSSIAGFRAFASGGVLSLEASEAANVRIVCPDGKIMRSLSIGGDESVSISGLPKGVYIVIADAASGVSTQKIVIA
ncbi:MAG: T9SS type A sorting domain-containing protein [Tannerella sp.]|jgi:hypothetical protein|nr:T9SS type A sorting domain-containing protein [Tannerella sp.]